MITTHITRCLASGTIGYTAKYYFLQATEQSITQETERLITQIASRRFAVEVTDSTVKQIIPYMTDFFSDLIYIFIYEGIQAAIHLRKLLLNTTHQTLTMNKWLNVAMRTARLGLYYCTKHMALNIAVKAISVTLSSPVMLISELIAIAISELFYELSIQRFQ